MSLNNAHMQNNLSAIIGDFHLTTVRQFHHRSDGNFIVRLIQQPHMIPLEKYEVLNYLNLVKINVKI